MSWNNTRHYKFSLKLIEELDTLIESSTKNNKKYCKKQIHTSSKKKKCKLLSFTLCAINKGLGNIKNKLLFIYFFK